MRPAASSAVSPTALSGMPRESSTVLREVAPAVPVSGDPVELGKTGPGLDCPLQAAMMPTKPIHQKRIEGLLRRIIGETSAFGKISGWLLPSHPCGHVQTAGPKAN